MQPRETRKFVKQFRQKCARLGLDAVVDLDRGAGSHRGVVVRDPSTGQTITFIIPGHRNLSQGVQRDILKYFKGLSTKSKTAYIICEILQEIFNDEQ